MRNAAVEYARRGWPVAPGTYQLAAQSGWLGHRNATELEPIVNVRSHDMLDRLCSGDA